METPNEPSAPVNDDLCQEQRPSEGLTTDTTSNSTYLRYAFALFSGLILFQCFSSIAVFLTNGRLIHTMRIAMNEGYLAVPNEKIFPMLEKISSAFCGGLFFTLTVGALVCLLALGGAVIYLSYPGSKKNLGAGLALLLLAVVTTINLNGFLLIETASIILCCCVVFFTCLYLFKNKRPEFSLKRMLLHVCPLIILAGLLVLSTQKKDSMIFTDFRDSFLMTNPIGMTINDFYYTYTLSPAEVFKSLDQKQIKSCKLILDVNDEPQRPQLERLLASKDVLVLENMDHPDLTLRSQNGQLMFYQGSSKIMEARVIDFIAGPSDLLKNFSKKTDSYAFYRKLTGIALITGLPLLMYLVMYSFFYAIFSLITQRPKASLSASIACFIIGLSFFFVLFIKNSEQITQTNLRDALSSSTLSRRVASLRYLSENTFDPVLYPSIFRSMASPSPIERYWFARAAARSSDPGIFNQMLNLIGDSQPNVACQAFYALGMLDNKQAIPEITKRIGDSNNWYVQWYAYKALKRLGWNQQRSDVKP